jgi:hypothetical protein
VGELGSARVGHRLQAAFGLAGLQLRGRDVDARAARQDAVIEVAEQVHRLGSGRLRARELAGDRGDPGFSGKRPAEYLPVARQPRGLDGALALFETGAQSAGDFVGVGEADRHRRRELPLSHSARDGNAAAKVADRLLVALGKVLREAQVVGTVEAQRERVVAERVETPRRLRRSILRGTDVAEAQLGEADEALGDDRQRGLVAPHRGLQAALGPGAHRGEVAVVERIGGQLDLEVGGNGRVGIGDVVQRGDQPAVRRLVTAEQVLAHRAAGDQPRPQRCERIVGRGQFQGAGQRRERLVEQARRRLALGQRDQQPQPLARTRDVLWQQPQRSAVPARSRSGRTRGGGCARADQDADRRDVARLRAALQVMSASGQRPSVLLERARRPRVGAQAPALRGGVIDRAAHQRMTEAIAPRNVGGRQQRGVEQDVERGQRRLLREAGSGDRDVEADRIADDGARTHEALGVLGQGANLLVEGQRNAARHIARRDRRGCRGARELLEVERVAA